MTKHITYFACILAMMMAVMITSLAQDNNTTANLTANGTTLNASSNSSTNASINSSLNASLIIAPQGIANGNNSSSTTALNNTTATALGNASPKKTIIVDTGLNQTSKNLSTVDNATITVAPISEMAKTAPEVAAASSSAQVAYAPEDALKLGSGVGGWDPSSPTHKEVSSQELGMPIKPMRDTEKMFFVCDIV
jgi:hypothetical protein